MPTPILKAARAIKAGMLVAFPTETVYGLGANALNPEAIAKIFEAKERPSFDPLIVHIADLEQLEDLVLKHDDRILTLAEQFWPGPLTIVVEKSDLVPGIVSSGLNTVGIRMPNHPVALDLIREAGLPIAAPSANKFGKLSPTDATHVLSKLPNVEIVLEGGRTAIGIESTIIRLHEDGFELLRPGYYSDLEISKYVPQSKQHSVLEHMAAPGMMNSHYSPVIPLYLTESEVPQEFSKSEMGYISFNKPMDGYAFHIRLSERNDLKDYAANMFAALHDMEESGVRAILIESVPEEGLGIAIMDRLKKAAHDYQ